MSSRAIARIWTPLRVKMLIAHRLTVEFVNETTTSGPVSLQRYEAAPSNSQNPYILPFAMRGFLEEELVRTRLADETSHLLRQFDNWRPSTKVLKDVKYRL